MLIPALVIAVAAVLVVLTLWGYAMWRVPPAPDPPGGNITVGDHRLHVTEMPGQEPAVVFIHGLPGSIRDWETVEPLIGDRHRIALDRPGFADTGGSALTMREQADVIADVLRALSVERALLVGHSYGGTVALTIARRHPELVGGIVLAAPMGGGRGMPLAMRNEARGLLFVTVPGIGDVIRRTVGWGITKLVVRRAFVRAFAPSPVAPAYEAHAYGLTMRPATLRSLYANRLDFNRDFGWLDRHLDEVTVPVGIVRAVDDAMVGSWSAVGLRDYLPNVVSFQECHGGHMIPFTRPETIAEAIAAVTNSMDRRGAARDDD
ncbi:MAG: alpha/beta hydrolase [Solirubrobacteraceae bacterium]|nr:alpha/beta hydrolase [Solirubrobacteraceae bacterium]